MRRPSNHEEAAMDTRRNYQRRESESADPTEPTIQLLASAIRMSWSPDEEYRRRVTRCDYTPPDAAPVNVRTLSGVPQGT
jgi:hypothetical protein